MSRTLPEPTGAEVSAILREPGFVEWFRRLNPGKPFVESQVEWELRILDDPAWQEVEQVKAEVESADAETVTASWKARGVLLRNNLILAIEGTASAALLPGAPTISFDDTRAAMEEMPDDDPWKAEAREILAPQYVAWIERCVKADALRRKMLICFEEYRADAEGTMWKLEETRIAEIEAGETDGDRPTRVFREWQKETP